MTRAERLCASLSRTFDTPKVGSKDGSSTIHEFTGPVASERYALLPPKSDAAAKALLAVGLKRGVSEVRLLENIRVRRGLPDLPSPRFDQFVSFLLDFPSPSFSRFAETCDSYTPGKHFLDLVSNASPWAVEGTQPGSLPQTGHSQGFKSYSDHQKLHHSGDSVTGPNDDVVDVKAVYTAQNHLSPKSDPAPLISSFHEASTESLPATPGSQNLIPLHLAHASEAPEKLAIDLLFNDQTGQVSIGLCFVPVKYFPEPVPQPFARLATSSAHAQVADATLSDKGVPSVKPNPSPSQVTPIKESLENHYPDSSPLGSKSVELHQEESCHVRPNAPALNITTLQDEIQGPTAFPSAPPFKEGKNAKQASQSDSGDEVILVEKGSKPAAARSSVPPVKARKKQTSRSAPRNTVALFARRKRVRDTVANASQPEVRTPNKIATALLQNRRTAAQSSFRETHLRRSRRKARPIAPIIDESDSEDEDGTRDNDEDFEPELGPVAMQHDGPEGARPVEAEQPFQEVSERPKRGLPPQKGKHVRFSDEVEKVQIPKQGDSSPASRTRSRRNGYMARQQKVTVSSSLDEDEEVLDSHDNVVSNRKIITPGRIRRTLSHPTGSKTSHPTSSKTERTGSTRACKESRKQTGSLDGIMKGRRQDLWKNGLMKFEEELKQDDVDSLTTDDDSDTPAYVRFPLLQVIVKRLREKSISFEELENINPEEETLRFYEETKNDPPYAADCESPGMKWVEECLMQTMGNQPGLFLYSNADKDVQHHSVDDQNEDDIYDLDKGTGRKIYTESSDSSDPLQSSDGEEGENGNLRTVVGGGSKRSRREARSRASKARELQGRVCGDLLPTMTFEARRRVLRWAERDFTWFDAGCDFMEIVAARSSKRCNRCNMPEDDDLMCEESILLKLWKDMSWRKVRRMRHRHSER
eukprot:gb/GEZJ01002626.1/.p1 GENE.gb/GEZJ01002626.1/~~gb/GEZJ01002626.1/.p1  ORF type:complete len:1013 (+),score=151.35 gb/GEZJ01002626.1/:263-3040(+)